MDEFITQLFAGIGLAAVLFMAAAGLNLIWGVLGIMNFATGSLYMLGAYGAFSATKALGSSAAAFAVALVVVPVLAGIAGAVTEALLLRRTYERDDESQQFMLTLALSYIVSGVVILAWGSKIRSIPVPHGLGGHWEIAGAVVPRYTVLTIAVGVAIVCGVAALLQRTRVGLHTRAARSDRDMAAALGVDVGRVYTFTFGVGAALGALAGVLVAPVTSITPNLDKTILISAFVIVVAGGLGRMDRVLYAALAVGLIQSFVTLESPVWAQLTPYAVMTAVLVVGAVRTVRQ